MRTSAHGVLLDCSESNTQRPACQNHRRWKLALKSDVPRQQNRVANRVASAGRTHENLHITLLQDAVLPARLALAVQHPRHHHGIERCHLNHKMAVLNQ